VRSSGASASCALVSGVDSEVLDFRAEGGLMNLFSVELKNQPGELAHLGDVCAHRGVDVQLAMVDTGGT
jgi:hypothetical protein